ncbi:MAG TPA: hypothetical protein VHP63_07325 [candidate division Zixibacteria bacterium]|nr:hypothetical protein [candidate division Zixibacteria bacterium]
MTGWSNWLKFPDPRNGAYLYAPFGPGVYELRLAHTNEKILVGKSKNVAYRMSSLLPEKYGSGTRNNSSKRQFVLENIEDIEYRTIPFESENLAASFEAKMLQDFEYSFNN